MEKRVKYGGILLFFLIMGLFLYGYFYHISEQSPALTLKTSIPIKATDLISLSDRDEALFNHQYLYKVLSVTGVIRKIRRNQHGIIVLLEGHPTQQEVISCDLDTLYASRQANLQPGDSCTILGNCAGRLKDIILLQCIIDK